MYLTSDVMQNALPERRHGDIPYYIHHFEQSDHAHQINAQHWRAFNCASKTQRAAIQRQIFSQHNPALIEPAFFCETPALMQFGQSVFINHNTALLGAHSISMNDGVLIGPNCIVSSRPIAGYPDPAATVTIESDVWVGANVLVLPGVTIGKQAIIGAGSVVSQCVAAHTTFYNASVFKG
nr:DapH/DapD/GlmU-related protein [Alteromonas lipotrueiana]